MNKLTGKANVIELRPDMTFSELKRKTEADNLLLTNDDSPSFKIGTSVFTETFSRSWLRKIIPFFKKRPRNLILHLEGANSCFSLEATKEQLESYIHHLWSKREKEKFVAKISAKRKAEQKAISTTYFLVLAMMLGIVIVIQILIARGVRIF